ncbi:MAG TPA: aminodeoxychorismate/anthranilate synthase component II [Methylomirabilota bacterium]|jgi:anthranilate synthase component 2|nr:aminodeoxychorismate/anthranilate synthase component II [Methylomirabilota bacterium]
MLLVIDNYDSFTYNLVQYLGELGATPVVRRNDRIALDEVERLAPAAIVISPGPGAPAQAGVSNALIRAFAGRCSILGVCLGHQCIGEVFGGVVSRAPAPIHGKTSRVYHDGRGVFTGLPNPFEATRYHSLIVRREGLPDVLEVSAWTEDGLVMGLRHRAAAVEGVQFHPESVLTAVGLDLLRNFLEGCEQPGATSGAWGRTAAPRWFG